MSEPEPTAYDVIVVGGGPAGLSGATALARSRRTVLVIDDGAPRNAKADGVHNLLTRDGTPPLEVLALGRQELQDYAVEIRASSVTAVRRDGSTFAVETPDGVLRARRVLLATGSRDVLPDIPGLAERWGVDVLHCAYCHGWEVQDQAIGVLVTNGMATHQALLFRQLSDRISLLQHTGPTPTEDELEQLAARGVEIVPGEVIEVLASASGLTGVRLDDGTVVGLDAVVVSPRAASRSTMLEPLGLVPTEFRMGETVLGDQIEADPTGATAVPGVYVAGNVASVPAQVVSSAAAGLMVGAAINADLVAEEVSEAVSSARDATAAAVPAR